MFATTFAVVATKPSVERATGIEPAFSAWEADVLPLNYARVKHNDIRPVTTLHGPLKLVVGTFAPVV
jgi:hypothetical protein